MRRRIYKGVACLLFLVTFCFSVQANESECYLENLGFSITFPSDYAVFTPEISNNDPLLQEFGFSRDALIGLMESKNMEVDAISRTTYDEITIVANPTSATEDFYTEAFLPMLQSGMQEVAGDKLDIYQCSLYKHDGKNLLYMTFYNGDVFSEGAGYTLISNGMAVNITFWPADHEISENDESILRSVVDTVKFSSHETETKRETPSILYTSPQTSISFTVPQNWQQEELSKEREILEAKFSAVNDGGNMIMYGCEDIWAAMPASEKVGLTRQKINQSYITATELKEMIECEETVKTATYNGVQYYHIEEPVQREVFGISYNSVMTQMIRIDNGWVHCFYFVGDEESLYYKDFEQLLESVVYPSYNEETETNNSTETTSTENLEDDRVTLIPLLILAGEAVVAVVILLVVQRRKRRKRKEKQFCPCCGKELLPQNHYCNYCGEEIKKKQERDRFII